MALSIDVTKTWAAGAGTPEKYTIRYVGTVDLVNIRAISGQYYGDVVLNIDAIVTNHPYNSQNSFPAGDFALLSYGDLNPKVNFPFTDGQSYYGATMPQPSSLPTNRCAVEFRGDTSRPNPNMVSLWISGVGNVISSESSEGTWTKHVSQTRTLQLDGSPNQPILTWSFSGAGPNHVEWLEQETWFTYAQFFKTLKYDANGGSGAPGNQQIPMSDPTFTVSSILPTHPDWKFKGWADTSTAQTATYLPGQSYPTFSGTEKTIYAVWEKDYRPGQILDNNTIWQSHNRNSGADNVYNGSSWQTMRTENGAVGQDNPPYMRHQSAWYNQRKIGANK